MFSIRTLFFSLLLLETVTAADDCCKNVTSRQYHQQFVNKWLDFWNGNTSLLNGLAEPDMITYQDRVPSPTGNGSESVYINSSDGLSQGMVYALSPYESYYFNLVGWAGMDTHLAVRWRMDAVLGKGAMGIAKQGDHVSVNGTDFLFLDECSGLIKIYDLAQDNISKYHGLGFTSVPV